MALRRCLRRQSIATTRSHYDREAAALYGKVQFVGMSVYKEEASASVPLDRIYIPLRVVPEGAADSGGSEVGTNPLTLLAPGAHHVILGDPGSGKSTLLKFLGLAGLLEPLRRRYGGEADARLPVFVTLRRYAEELKAEPELSLDDFILRSGAADFDLPALTREFLEYYLYAGQAILLIDGVDELPTPALKQVMRARLATLLRAYPGNTVLVTSRIVGYDAEVRLDDLGFAHHRVARLNLKEVEGFVLDWYSARIDNARERERHVADLVRIMRDADSRAIRELGENPLLLTIICLVHRIDAVLPDERVVLYQKCTETLLNTWHAWKAQAEQPRNRNKVERRNRARMEAIAYWMHCQGDAKRGATRTVVPYGDLRSFLAEYLQEIEGLATQDAYIAAAEFLEFVKVKAGLLIEAGTDLYSFVHLTFQEYLTANYLRKTGEAAGVSQVWQFVEQYCADPRWHEVLRLLVGSFERSESQAYLLDRVLGDGSTDGSLRRALVAGGCLIDSIDAAEDMASEILKVLLHAAIRVDTVDELREALRMLRVWQEREPANAASLVALAREYEGDLLDGVAPAALALTLGCLGHDGELARIGAASPRWGQVANLFGWRLDGPTEDVLSAPERELLSAACVSRCLVSPFDNFTALVLAGLCPTDGIGWPCPPFTQLLATVLGLYGPFHHQVLVCVRSRDGSSPMNGESAMSRALARSVDVRQRREPTLRRRREKLLEDALRGPRRSVERALKRVRVAATVLGRTIASEHGRLSQRGNRAVDELHDHGIPDTWEMVESDAAWHGPTIDMLCDLLDLRPRPHAWEALRLLSLPKVPGRITLADPQVWDETIAAFRRGEAAERWCLHAASQLLLDVWCWIYDGYDAPQDSPFFQLAELTRKVEHPALQVAHAIRRTAFGEDAESSGLARMLRSKDERYRRLFEAAFWIEPRGKVSEDAHDD